MLRDAFYFGNKPNVHPKERYAKDLNEARELATTEHFWIINELCDYTNFDWDFDFEFLPDEDVWIKDFNNVWPSTINQDSGTWLCPKIQNDTFLYRSECEPLKLKNNHWKILDHVNLESVNFDWLPDPYDPPYIYTWGSKYIPAELHPVLEYHTDGATDRKYMGTVEMLPQLERWTEYLKVDRNKFDINWRPDPREPAYIYVWGNKYDPPEVKPTIEYRVPGATDKKYMGIVDLEPEWDRWHEYIKVDKTKFDLSWRPDPNLHEPPYIYVWGNKYIPGEIQSTIEYRVPGAIEKKYMGDDVEVIPEYDRWKDCQKIDKTKFDLSWRPDPREPAYIYVWGNKYIPGEIQSTLEYHVPGATQQKYMGNDVEVLPELDRWVEVQLIDRTKFDLSWRPDPREPAYIYVWGNKYIPGEIQSTLEYHVPGATQQKYMGDDVEVIPEQDRWKILQKIDKTKFDLSWRPDPREPAYIYVWGNKYIPGEIQSTIEYHVPGATQQKYMGDVEVLPEIKRWEEIIKVDKTKFDMTWRPDPREPAYIYVWGNKFYPPEEKPTLIYRVPDATEYKYMGIVDLEPEWDRWKEIQSIDKTKFDMSWRPDPRLEEPPYIYIWGNKYVPGEIQSTLEYYVPGATDKKYMGDIEVLPEIEKWVEHVTVDKIKFDMSWRPDPREPAYIYVWGNKYDPPEVKPTLEYYAPGATEKKYMGIVDLEPEWDRWKLCQNVDKTKFDFSWRPDPNLHEPPYIYIWGSRFDTGEINPALEYHVPGATDKKYMNEPVELLSEQDRWKEFILVDRSCFDFTWRPSINEPPYIYVWGNKFDPAEVKPTLEYHVPGATDKKYMGTVELAPEYDRWKEYQIVDKTKFDFRWRPDPNLHEQPYIYVWGNKYIPGELEPTLEYHVPGATEKKYMGIVDVLPEYDRWKDCQKIDRTKFDMTWRPDPREPAYIYIWGSKFDPGEIISALEYHVPGATEKKYMTTTVELLPELDRWVEHILVDRNTFDFTWRPSVNEPPYIYVWGNKFDIAEKKPTLEYIVPGAKEKKYMGIVDLAPEYDRWKELIPIDRNSFDFRWRPDPNLHEPPMIYVFGNKWNDSKTEPTLEYHVPGAVIRKYMDHPVAIPRVDMSKWTVTNKEDLETFDFSWRPNPHSPPQIYQWENNGPRYTVTNASEVVLMEYLNDNRVGLVARYVIRTTLEDLIKEHEDEVFWALNPDLNYDKFDFGWRPDKNNFRHLNVFGNEDNKNTQTYYVNGPMYKLGYRELNYIEDKSIQIQTNLSMFYIDKNNRGRDRFDQLKERYPNIQRTRYLNSWVETIQRCCNKSETKLFWVLNSELDYTEFNFDFYPSPWQMSMVHVFGTQWSHWGNTYLINKETFVESTKYVKIIEHLNILNFVKNKKTRAVEKLYDTVLIDHGNMHQLTAEYTVKYEKTYLETFKNVLSVLPEQKEHFVWVISSICNYDSFDFTYICDPYAKEQLHVFPSDKQKFGDTFLVNVNKLRELVGKLEKLENYDKVNFNQHQRVKRLAPPVIHVPDDTHCNSVNIEFDFPYAIFQTEDILVNDDEPINLWETETKAITVTSTGASRIVVPKEAKDYVKKELYDYPYIKTMDKLNKSRPLDIIFFSNGEANADENYEHLLFLTAGLENKVVRVDGIKGRVASQHAAANTSNTPWYFLVNAKLKVNEKFDFDWQPDRLQIPKHYIFTATNPLNGLEYGHMAIVANNKKLTLSTNVRGLDFTMDSEHEVVKINSGLALYNSSPWDTWRTSFREVIKLKHSVETNPTLETRYRLKTWLNIGDGINGEYSILGAKNAVEYYESVNGDFEKLKLSYDWAWLQERFNK